LTAEFALQHYRVFQEQADRICRERMRVERIMDSLDQITPYPSDANFVLFRCDGCDAEEVFQGLLQHQVLIKNLHSPGTALQNCLRATVGKAHENEAFLNALSLLVTTDYSLQ
jgi:histidinol-phosphate aminotransferase